MWPPAPSTTAGRAAVAVLVCTAVWLVGPADAGAGPVRPGGTEAVIDAVEPPPRGVEVRVVGGDDFLEVEAAPGTEVLVPGYSGEPYLRIRTDGVVEQNARSPAVALNTERYAGRDGDVVPTAVDPDAAPEWVPTGGTHRVAWHDHRIHWMLPNDPVAAPDGVIQTFEVPMQVDGTEVVVTGRLLLVDRGPPWAAGLAILLALVGSVALHRARRPGVETIDLRPWGPPMLVAGGAAALLASVGNVLATPPEAGGVAWSLVLAGVASAAGVVAGAPLRRWAVPAGVVAIAALNGWWVPRAGVMWAAVVPTTWPGWVDRSATAVAAGVAVACLLAAAGARVPGRVSGAGT